MRDADVALEPQTVQALPPSQEYPFGQCNAVLVVDHQSQEEAQTSGIGGMRISGCCISLTIVAGHSVAQIRCIFRPHSKDSTTVHQALAYVYWFTRPR